MRSSLYLVNRRFQADESREYSVDGIFPEDESHKHSGCTGVEAGLQ